MSPRAKKEPVVGGFDVVCKMKKLDRHFTDYSEASEYAEEMLKKDSVDSVMVRAGSKDEEVGEGA